MWALRGSNSIQKFDERCRSVECPFRSRMSSLKRRSALAFLKLRLAIHTLASLSPFHLKDFPQFTVKTRSCDNLYHGTYKPPTVTHHNLAAGLSQNNLPLSSAVLFILWKLFVTVSTLDCLAPTVYTILSKNYSNLSF